MISIGNSYKLLTKYMCALISPRKELIAPNTENVCTVLVIKFIVHSQNVFLTKFSLFHLNSTQVTAMTCAPFVRAHSRHLKVSHFTSDTYFDHSQFSPCLREGRAANLVARARDPLWEESWGSGSPK